MKYSNRFISKDLSPGEKHIQAWYTRKGWQQFAFQREMMEAYLAGRSGLLNAPTGSGKTLAMWLPILAEFLNSQAEGKAETKKGMRVLWITPLRALAKDVQLAMQEACDELEIPWRVALRTGDTTAAERQKMKRNPPECIITTPESMHMMLAQSDAAKVFANLQAFVVDEWHELLGTKRGVQIELGLSRLRQLTIKPHLPVWGISATVGNLQEAMQVLIGARAEEGALVRAENKKRIRVQTIIPERIDTFPWTGYAGLKMAPMVLPLIEQSNTTLLFTNTRAQTELWYQKLLELQPDLAGAIAMHHGSIDQNIRTWVEDAIKWGRIKVVVCTSSLDLGVDFAPVDTIIQIGSPKGVARFLQRAGRSGHQPGAVSKIFFVPTHSLELVEAAALQQAIKEELMETRHPVLKPMDVLVQYLVTLAVGEGFDQKTIRKEIAATYAYQDFSDEEWSWALDFITHGGKSLGAYDEFSKVNRDGDFYKVESKRTALRHRLSMGTIVSNPALRLKFISGGYIGTIEESFVSKLKPGDVFGFAGRSLEFVRLQNLTAYVRNSKRKATLIPSWAGSRMPLSSQLSAVLRQKVSEAARGELIGPEMQKLDYLFRIQNRWSMVPTEGDLLIEAVKSREGYHVFFYPFEGRVVHEILAALIAYRISRNQPITLSIAMNDYGFELLADTEIDIEGALEADLFSVEGVLDDIEAALNETEMARRKFRDIASIAGLVFQGFPGKPLGSRHLQSSAQVIFDTLRQYEPDNLLLRQAFDEVLDFQVVESRLMDTLHRIRSQKLQLQYPPKFTPFAFPIMVDRMREKISSEKLEDRVARMTLELERYAEGGEKGSNGRA
jgi:ATP-dependent helicase Lhr and Lhr-like helicase